MRVLLVDDHELFRAGLALLVKELFPDVELLHASTLTRGVDLATIEHPDIVFLDLELPDGHGCNALAQLKVARPSLPVVVISADESVETVARCRTSGDGLRAEIVVAPSAACRDRRRTLGRCVPARGEHRRAETRSRHRRGTGMHISKSAAER